MTDTLTWAGNVIMLSSLPAIAAFTALYGIRSNWRARGVGRALFWLAASMTVVQLVFLAAVFFPDWPGRAIARIVAYGFVSFNIWRLLYQLLRIQERERSAIKEASK